MGRSAGYRESYLGNRSCLDSAGNGVTPIVFRHSGGDFQGMGVFRSDEGLGKGAWQAVSRRSRRCRRAQPPPVSGLLRRTSSLAPLAPGQSCHFRAKKELSVAVVEGLSSKAKVTVGISYGFRAFRITELLPYQAIGKLPGVPPTHKFYGRSRIPRLRSLSRK